MKKIILYTPDINIVGGIETFFYLFATSELRNYYDITVVAEACPPAQRDKFYKAGVKINIGIPNYLYADILILGSFISMKHLKNITAPIVYQGIHANWNNDFFKDFRRDHLQRFCDEANDIIDAYICVSKPSAIPIRKCTDKPVYVIENIPPPRAMQTVEIACLSRPTAEKGFDNLIAFAKNLERIGANIHLYSTQPIRGIGNIINHGVNLDAASVIAKHDYLLQLSETESYCYAAMEALSVGVPIIVPSTWQILDEFFEFPRDGFTVDDPATFDVFKLVERRFVTEYAMGERRSGIIKQWRNLLK